MCRPQTHLSLSLRRPPATIPSTQAHIKQTRGFKKEVTKIYESGVYVYKVPLLAYKPLCPLPLYYFLKQVWAPKMAVSIRSSFHVVRTEQRSQKTLSGKMCFGLDLLEELFGLAQNSPNYYVFFHLAFVFAGWNPRGGYYYIGVKQGHLL